MALLEVDGLVGGYRRDHDILTGVSLRVEEGQMVSIIGPNGAGKSTVLKAIFGLLDLRIGQIGFDGNDIGPDPPTRRLRRGLSFVPQGRNIFPELSVADNMLLGAYIRRDKREVSRELSTVYEMFPLLAEKRNQTAGRLSGGQMQLLEMARAMLIHPKLMMIDEPSLGLSPNLAQEVFNTIADVKRQGTAILIVEQNAEASLRMSEYAYVIETGGNGLEGPAEQMRTDDQVKAAYLGQ